MVLVTSQKTDISINHIEKAQYFVPNINMVNISGGYFSNKPFWHQPYFCFIDFCFIVPF
jgi:hypothetical protein